MDCLNSCLLIITFCEITSKYESDLKTQFVSLDIIRTITWDRRGPFISNFVKWFIYLLSYDLSKILAKLVISFKHNIIFAKFIEMLLTITYLFHIHTFADKVKIIWKLFELIFSNFLLKALSHQNVFKNALKKFNAPRF